MNDCFFSGNDEEEEVQKHNIPAFPALDSVQSTAEGEQHQVSVEFHKI